MKVFDYLPKRIQKGKKATTEIHIHLPAHFGVAGPSTTKAVKASETVTNEVNEMSEPSPSAFKTKVDHSSWEF